jgi:hypothetical protein
MLISSARCHPPRDSARRRETRRSANLRHMELDEIQYAGRIQLLIFIGALVVSSIATAIAIAQPGASILWVGGFLIVIFAAYRSARIYFSLFRLRRYLHSSPLSKIDFGLIAISGVLLIVVLFTLLPEFVRVQSPTQGTCWAETEESSEYLSPVACWSGDAIFKTVSQASSPSGCPSGQYVESSSSEKKVDCLGRP